MKADEESHAVNPYGEESPVGMMDLSRASRILQQVRPWVLFLGVLAMVMAVLLASGTVLVSLSTAFDADFPLPFPVWVFAMLYVAGAVIYFLPALFLLKFGRRISEFSRNQTIGQLNAALSAQKSFWKTIGICALSILAVYLALIVGAVFVGVSVS